MLHAGSAVTYGCARTSNGVFAKAKARTVVAGHSRSIRRNVDYKISDVFAPAPRLETGRTLQAFACMFNMHRYAVDAIQAYLIGTPSPDQHYPVRYPDGPIRERHRGGTWGRRLAASGVFLTTITLPHASFGPSK